MNLNYGKRILSENIYVNLQNLISKVSGVQVFTFRAVISPVVG